VDALVELDLIVPYFLRDGFASPDDVSIQAAIEANDAFIARLEAIRDGAQGLTLEQED